MPDFRAAERTFQLLTQVAGRAGRGDAAGEVIVQTHMPEHYALVHACAQDYDAFFERELEFRRTMGYPPTAALVNLIVRATDEDKGRQAVGGAGRAAPERRARPLPRARPRSGAARAPAPGAPLPDPAEGPAQGDARRRAQRRSCARYGETRWPGVAVDVDPLTVM